MAIKLYGVVSGRSISGLNRIGRMIMPDIEIVKDGPADPSLYQGVICHNYMGDPFGKKLPRIVFLASCKTGSLALNKKTRRLFLAHPPDALWVNQESGRLALKKVGIEATTMFRPNRLAIPSEEPLPFNEKKILWHWHPGSWMSPKLEAGIAKAMRSLKDFEILVISGLRDKSLKPAGKGLDHVTGGGWIDLRTDMNQYAGIVRVYDVPCMFDLGRSTFQAFAYGRWNICRATREPLVDTIHRVEEIPALVRSLVKGDNQKIARKRWKYIRSNFTEEALHERWVKAVKEVIHA